MLATTATLSSVWGCGSCSPMISICSARKYMQIAVDLVTFCLPLEKWVHRPLELTVIYLKLGAPLTTYLTCGSWPGIPAALGSRICLVFP